MLKISWAKFYLQTSVALSPSTDYVPDCLMVLCKSLKVASSCRVNPATSINGDACRELRKEIRNFASLDGSAARVLAI